MKSMIAHFFQMFWVVPGSPVNPGISSEIHLLDESTFFLFQVKRRYGLLSLYFQGSL